MPQPYISRWDSPLGSLLMASDGTALTGLWFEGQRHCPRDLESRGKAEDLPVFGDARRWLSLYFSGKEPDFSLPLRPEGSEFQQRVWHILAQIPYGQTMTYGQIAGILGVPSAQAVGGAVGRNPISILIPCHRVVGARGLLTGYAAGLHRKEALLQLEQKISPDNQG